MPKRGVLAFFCLVLGLTLASASGRAPVVAQASEVDMALVLAIDCSFSVDANEFRLQMEGLGQAFTRPEVKEAIAKGPNGRIAVIAMQWSDEANQMVIVPWTVIAGDNDANRLGAALMEIPRRLAEGGTSISMAMEYAASLFNDAPPSPRRVIDISSDGRNNIGPPVALSRNKVVKMGITVNALTILSYGISAMNAIRIPIVQITRSPVAALIAPSPGFRQACGYPRRVGHRVNIRVDN